MRRWATGLALLCLALLLPSTSIADTVLFDYGFNMNGIIYTPADPLPASLNTAAFDFNTGLGSLTLQFVAPAADSYSFLAFFDHEIDEKTNTFFNEYGSPFGTPASGQSWEIDEPGFVFGDIYDNFKAAALDNSNGVPSAQPDDVSMALGWRLALSPGDTATIKFNVSTMAPASGFYLQQTDPDSLVNIYFSSTQTVQPGGGPAVPEPATVVLLGSGLLLAWRRTKR